MSGQISARYPTSSRNQMYATTGVSGFQEVGSTSMETRNGGAETSFVNVEKQSGDWAARPQAIENAAATASPDHPANANTNATPAAAATVKPLPYWQSALLAAVYVGTGSAYFLSIRYSKTKYGDAFTYDSTLIVFTIELSKLIACCVLYQWQERKSLLKTVFGGSRAARAAVWRAGRLCFVPSLLYAMYNNMTFMSLGLLDVVTYAVLLQSRMLFTGVLFTFLLSKPLSLRQWVVLVALMFTCAAQAYASGSNSDAKPANGNKTTATITTNGAGNANNNNNGNGNHDTNKNGMSSITDGYGSGVVMLLKVLCVVFQAALASLAGVYNEYVFKKHAALSIHVQNFFMYFSALFFNVAMSLLVQPRTLYSTVTNIRQSLHWSLLPVVLSGVAMGLTTAFILKFIDSIVKTIAAAVDLLLTALLASLLLGEALTLVNVMVVLIVVGSVFVYNTPGAGDAILITCGRRRAAPVAATETTAAATKAGGGSILTSSVDKHSDDDDEGKP